jgi:hypothetical protein
VRLTYRYRRDTSKVCFFYGSFSKTATYPEIEGNVLITPSIISAKYFIGDIIDVTVEPSALINDEHWEIANYQWIGAIPINVANKSVARLSLINLGKYTVEGRIIYRLIDNATIQKTLSGEISFNTEVLPQLVLQPVLNVKDTTFKVEEEYEIEISFDNVINGDYWILDHVEWTNAIAQEDSTKAKFVPSNTGNMYIYAKAVFKDAYNRNNIKEFNRMATIPVVFGDQDIGTMEIFPEYTDIYYGDDVEFSSKITLLNDTTSEWNIESIEIPDYMTFEPAIIENNNYSIRMRIEDIRETKIFEIVVGLESTVYNDIIRYVSTEWTTTVLPLPEIEFSSQLLTNPSVINTNTEATLTLGVILDSNTDDNWEIISIEWSNAEKDSVSDNIATFESRDIPGIYEVSVDIEFRSYRNPHITKVINRSFDVEVV